MAAAAEQTIKTGIKSSVTSSDGPNGQRICTLTKDRKVTDPRTRKQLFADHDWLRHLNGDRR